MPAGRKVRLAFEHIAPVTEHLAVEAGSVGRAGYGYARVTRRPSPRVELVDPTPRVSAGVRRIVPGAVVHHRPSHELGPRIVGVAVVVEKVGDAEAPDRHRVPRH